MGRRENKINKLQRIDYNIIITTLFAISFGLVMVYSSTVYMINEEKGITESYFLLKQIKSCCIGIVGAFVIMNLNYKCISVSAQGGFLLSCFMIISLYRLGKEINGAKRWLEIFGISVQVAEIVKIAVILKIAYVLEKHRANNKEIHKGLIIGIGFIPAIMILGISRDLGSSIVIFGIAFIMSYIYTDKDKMHGYVFLGGIIIAISSVVYVFFTMPPENQIRSKIHMYQRIAAWIDKDKYLMTVGSQTREGQYAISLGGFTGRGLGRSIQKMGRVPEAQTDMILAIVGEELGMIGLIAYLLIIGYLVSLSMKVAKNNKNYFCSSMACGVGIHLFLQTWINISVVLGVIPNTGITAPFMSYGGTSMVFFLGEIGLLLWAEKQGRMKTKLKSK